MLTFVSLLFVFYLPWFDPKFVILTPWIAHSMYSLTSNGRDPVYFLIFPFILVRMLHNQIWVSVSRYRTAKGKNRIVDRGLEFDQLDRESNWFNNLTCSSVSLVNYLWKKLPIDIPLSVSV